MYTFGQFQSCVCWKWMMGQHTNTLRKGRMLRRNLNNNNQNKKRSDNSEVVWCSDVSDYSLIWHKVKGLIWHKVKTLFCFYKSKQKWYFITHHLHASLSCNIYWRVNTAQSETAIMNHADIKNNIMFLIINSPII